ncbi:MAG: winged helix-turn-helix domain-containing protein [Nitrososphaerales archaeon]
MTHEHQYFTPILEALVELGGKAKTHVVLEKVGEKMKNLLKPKDYEKLPSGKAIRWQISAMWARWRLIEKGYLRRDSPRGVWEITDKGRRILQETSR